MNLSNHLPDATQTLQFIQEPKTYTEIADQARIEMHCLQNLENIMEAGQMGKNILQQNGYEAWLKDAQNEDRLRLVGALKLILEFCEELAED